MRQRHSCSESCWMGSFPFMTQTHVLQMKKLLPLQAVILLIGSTATTSITTTPAPALPSCGAGYTGPNGDCSACPSGKYKPGAGSADCQECEPGKCQDSIAAAACDECVEGKYSSETGANYNSTCTQCIQGTYSSVTGNLFQLMYSMR